MIPYNPPVTKKITHPITKAVKPFIYSEVDTNNTITSTWYMQDPVENVRLMQKTYRFPYNEIDIPDMYLSHYFKTLIQEILDLYESGFTEVPLKKLFLFSRYTAIYNSHTSGRIEIQDPTPDLIQQISYSELIIPNTNIL